jgi:hypothetical protein
MTVAGLAPTTQGSKPPSRPLAALGSRSANDTTAIDALGDLVIRPARAQHRYDDHHDDADQRGRVADPVDTMRPHPEHDEQCGKRGYERTHTRGGGDRHQLGRNQHEPTIPGVPRCIGRRDHRRRHQGNRAFKHNQP